ncbi:hypothetical protein ACQKPX_24170 [Photobacterium sp. DNB23_23_1]
MTDIDSNYNRVSSSERNEYDNQVLAVNQLMIEQNMLSQLSLARWVYAEGILSQFDESEISDIIDQVQIIKISYITPHPAKP